MLLVDDLAKYFVGKGPKLLLVGSTSIFGNTVYSCYCKHRLVTYEALHGGG